MTKHEFETRVKPLLEHLAALEERLGKVEGQLRQLQQEHGPLFEPLPSVTAPLNTVSTFHGITICPACGLGYSIGTQHFCQPKTGGTGIYLVQ